MPLGLSLSFPIPFLLAPGVGHDQVSASSWPGFASLPLAVAARDGREAGRFERAAKITPAE
jgi:hypothetical protein